MVELNDWEKKLLVNENAVNKAVFDGYEIEYRCMPWMVEEEIQARFLMKINSQSKSFDNDTAGYGLEVLRWGVLKGPWNPEVKEAVLVKLTPKIKDELIKLITNRKDSNVKKN